MTKKYVAYDMLFVILSMGVLSMGGIFSIATGTSVGIVSLYLMFKDIVASNKVKVNV